MSGDNQQLIETLRKLAEERATGTLFLTQPDHRQARIGLQRGQIVHLALFTLRGELVIRALSRRPPLSFSFQPGAVPEEQGGLPDNAVILEWLASGGPLQGAVAEPAPPTLPAAVLRIVTQELAYFAGPMAAILVEEQRGARSVEALLTGLARNLDDPADAEVFRRKVQERLQAGG